MGNTETKLQTFGYRIIKVAPKSPAKDAGLTEFLDYIIDVDDLKDETQFSSDYDNFHKLIHSHENQIITLNVYNILTRNTRKVPIIPNKNWEKADSLLGILVRYEDYASAHERVLKVKAVKPNSPASSIGLEPENDYILGSSNHIQFNGPTETIELEDAGPMEVFIYNARKKNVWSALVTPPSSWDKGGYLGCEFDPEGSSPLPNPNDVATKKRSDLKEKRRSPLKERQENENLDFSSQRNKNSSESRSLQDITNSRKERVFPESELKPPKDSEIQKIRTPTYGGDLVRDSRSFSLDLSKELVDHRFKELYQKNIRKGSYMLVSQPFMDTGISSTYFNHGAKTLGNLDEPELLSPPKVQSFKDLDSYHRDFKEFDKATVPQTTSLTHTEDSIHHVQAEDKGDNQIHLQPYSLLSVTSEINEDKKTGTDNNTNEKNENITQHAYFSKKIGGDYIINSTDLFAIDHMHLIDAKKTLTA